jgi:pyruvate/2-oxoglutarate dehydrogenase complex dihydrolipoamide acyltransferase (E2) component
VKRLMVLAASFVFVFSAYIFAAEGPSATPAKTEPPKVASMKPHKETRVSITGVVKEISDTMITVERTVKGKTETMGFVLNKPVEKIKVGEKVRVSYIKREDKYIAIRVTPFTVKIIKKATPLKAIKPSPTEPAKK